jgi:hypothetical protein
MRDFIAWIAAFAAIVAAGFWIMSAVAKEPAPKQTAGVGALLGGYLIVRDAHGNRLDLPRTLQKQSMWNRWAAISAAAGAVLAAILLLLPQACQG